MSDKKYYIGLDIGTSSVGWAVTDEHYNVIRRKGKDMWGARLFDEAKPAADRRTRRIDRRRLQREKQRIAYLNHVFEPEINKIDPGFFQRLEDSKYYKEDKTIIQPYGIFADPEYTDVDYYDLEDGFPTIFHLRKALIECKEKKYDVRLVYLAILNIFKHRGHFLYPNLKEGSIADLGELLENLNTLFYEEFEENMPMVADINKLQDILTDQSVDNSIRLNRVLDETGSPKKEKEYKQIVGMWNLMCGLKGKFADIFILDEFPEDKAKFSMNFGDTDYEDLILEAEELLCQESFDLLMAMKEVYDWCALATIMIENGKPYEYLSLARCAKYEQHKKDLKILKKLYRKYLPEKYDDMFRKMNNDSYSAYIGSVNSKYGKVRRGAKKYDDFFKNIEKDMNAIKKQAPEELDCQYVLDRIKKNEFLPKQSTTDNGIIPNQLHKAELRKILENAEEYLPFLKEEGDKGLTASERLLQIFSFQLPYYVGPLKKSENSNAWVERKDYSGPVYPWNLEEKVDIEKTNENFINRLIGECSYIQGAKVLPKSSLLYERFMVLNELNPLKINDQEIPVELKQAIFKDLFMRD